MARFLQLAGALGLFFMEAAAVNTVKMEGANFIDSSTGSRVMIIGVDYQPGGQAGYNPSNGMDPLSNSTVCLRDAALMQDLGLNTIRTYNVDPDLNHDECASIFNEVGIYMIVDVNSPLGGESIDRSNPKGSYNAAYLNRTFAVVEAFMNYPNTLAFFAGNEIINDVPTSKDNPPYIRAVQRDIKAYIAKHSTRSIPVGYSAADVREVLQDTWAYLQCAIDGDAQADTSRSDFFGLNSYSWCGSDATLQSSQYDQLDSMFGSTTIPVFFSEYGCNTPSPRVFDEVPALYGPQMTALSGGLVYEFSQEPSNFGLVQVNDNSTAQLLVDYDNFQGQMKKLNVSLLESANPSATSAKPPACSKGLVTSGDFGADWNLPKTPSDAQDLINNGVPNAQQGKIVSISDTNVPIAVYASNGQQIQNLAIKPLQDGQANSPNTAGTSGAQTNNTDPNAKPSAAPEGVKLHVALTVAFASLAAILLL
ncbi:MAG: hypothetical protein M1820_001219 [Bogoriella megaspora]|nr:MAG: hypothetical protein M1820_001219 [Bogoriella megaspora]